MKKIIYLAFLFLISYKLFAVIPEDTTQVAGSLAVINEIIESCACIPER